MRRPSFFLSSTIYDFRDLRSSVKYFLEQQGCSVLASEFNDFPKPLDTHSYEACLQALQKADYFVLFIGSRVGGWFDKDDRVSITQQEYREAYKLHKQGKLKLISFVRSDIWQLREDRKELARFLETSGVDPGLAASIKSHPTKSASDALFISAFIDEVSRNQETKAALDGKSPMPTGNWLHVFDNFRDVVDVLQAQAFAGRPVEHAVLRRLLLREMLEILRVSLWKTNRRDKQVALHSPEAAVYMFHHHNPIPLTARDQDLIEVKTRQWDQLTIFGFNLLNLAYRPMLVQRALESAAFLNYDLKSEAFVEDPVYEALFKLNEEIRTFNSSNTTETVSVIFAHTPKRRDPGVQSIWVEPLKLLPFLFLMDRWVNVIELALAIARYLGGKPFAMPTSLRPRSPIHEMNEALELETVSLEDAKWFVENHGK